MSEANVSMSSDATTHIGQNRGYLAYLFGRDDGFVLSMITHDYVVVLVLSWFITVTVCSDDGTYKIVYIEQNRSLAVSASTFLP